MNVEIFQIDDTWRYAAYRFGFKYGFYIDSNATLMGYTPVMAAIKSSYSTYISGDDTYALTYVRPTRSDTDIMWEKYKIIHYFDYGKKRDYFFFKYEEDYYNILLIL